MAQIKNYVSTSNTNSKSKKPQKQTQMLNQKLAVISPTIDILEAVASRGNTTLTPIIDLTQTLRKNIAQLAKKIVSNDKKLNDEIENDISGLLLYINDIVPFLQLAISTCGVNFSTTLIESVSPSRLLLASNFLANPQISKTGKTQIGPTFRFRLFYLFGSSLRQKDHADWSWKEEYPVCHISIQKPENDKFKFNILFTEDFNDSRFHNDDDIPGSKLYSLSNLKKVMYSSSSSLLNISDAGDSVLMLKIDTILPGGEQINILNNENVKVEWFALESLDDNDDDEDDSSSESDTSSNSDDDDDKNGKKGKLNIENDQNSTKISILEYILKLAYLEETENKSHITMTDEKLNIYLSDSFDDGFKDTRILPVHPKKQQSPFKIAKKRVGKRESLDSQFKKDSTTPTRSPTRGLSGRMDALVLESEFENGEKEVAK